MAYKLDKAQELSTTMIAKYVEKHMEEEAHLNKLKNYYTGNHAILNRTMADITKPNNRAVNPYPSYITDMFCGYFMGEPIAYSSEEEEFIDEITKLFNYNDEASENAELAKDASVFGIAYELVYLDSNKDIRFKKLSPQNCIPIYDNTVEEELLYVIRYYTNIDIVSGNDTTFVEVYGKSAMTLYEKSEIAYKFIDETPHSFSAVPIIIYQNNEEEIGDFEPVLSLIDSYDKLQADSVNDLEYFNDAYLALYGLSGTEAEDIASMKQMRVMLMPSDSKAEWLIKDINDTYVENLKNRIDKDIHKFAMCPPLTDDNFAHNSSGVALKYKLMGLENATSKKERNFKKALQRRLEIICNMFAVFGTSYDWRTINISFKRNLPSNLVEAAEVISKVGNLLSEETRIGLLPLDIDYSAEKVKKEKEAIAGYHDGFEEVNNDELLAEENT